MVSLGFPQILQLPWGQLTAWQMLPHLPAHSCSPHCVERAQRQERERPPHGGTGRTQKR